MRRITALFHTLRASLRVRLTLGVVLPLVVVLGVFNFVQSQRQREATLQQLSFASGQTAQVIENSLQHEMLSNNLEGIQHMLNGISQDKKIRLVYLMSITGTVAFAPNGWGVGNQLSNHDPTCRPCHDRLPSERPPSIIVTLPDGRRVFRSMNPIENLKECHKCHDADQRLAGVLLTDIWVEPFEARLAGEQRENLLWAGGAILITVVVVLVTTSRLVVRRLERVARTLARFGPSELDLRLADEGPDELGQLASAFNQMGQRLKAEADQNDLLTQDLRRLTAEQRQLLQRLITAQEAERRRVAGDLHDGLGQELAGLAFGLEAVERLTRDKPDQALGQLRLLRIRIAEMTNQVYDMIMALRPSALDDLGLTPALRAQAERTLRDSGLHFELEAKGLRQRLPAEAETVLFRVFQEGLHNIVRHARARQVRLILTITNDQFEGELRDDGCGFDLASVRVDGQSARGLGLLGMQERVKQLGGELRIETAPGAGTRIVVHLPLEGDLE